MILVFLSFECLQMQEEMMMARIRDAEKGQLIAEFTQKVSLLELKVRVLNNRLLSEL